MAKWWMNVKKVKYSKYKYNDGKPTGNKRFLNSFDMAELKRMESITNSQIKRGEIPAGNFRYMYVCSCGVSGCNGVNEITVTPEQAKAWKER